MSYTFCRSTGFVLAEKKKEIMLDILVDYNALNYQKA